MSNLPINKSDIVTPFNISASENVDIVTAANNKTSLARRGGFHYLLTMGIRPYNVIRDKDNAKYWSISTFLNRYPFFYVPLYNLVAPTVTGSVTTGGGDIGSTQLTISAGGFRPGMFIKFEGKDKIYQIASAGSSKITLAHPLVATVSSGTSVIYKETNTVDGELMNGIYGKFINEDFGNPVNRIEDGILGKIGPLSLKEKL